MSSNQWVCLFVAFKQSGIQDVRDIINMHHKDITSLQYMDDQGVERPILMHMLSLIHILKAYHLHHRHQQGNLIGDNWTSNTATKRCSMTTWWTWLCHSSHHGGNTYYSVYSKYNDYNSGSYHGGNTYSVYSKYNDHNSATVCSWHCCWFQEWD